MNYVVKAHVALIACLTFPALAWGQSLTGNVGSAGISAGDRSVEARAGVDHEGNLASRFHYDQALSDWYQLRVIAAFAKPEGGDLDFSGMTLENWLQWSEEGDDQSGFNGGLRFAYTFADSGGPDEAAVRFTLTDRFAGAWEWRANAIAEVETGGGREDGVALQTRLQLTRAIDVDLFGTPKWRFGAELFSEYGNTEDIPGFGQQAHQAGPVVKAEWDNGIFVQAAVRTGLTDGADDLMGKIFIGREF
ncbi:MAG TPA: hypothetical protein PKV67_11410 [Hyphomonas sp.]|nr:hypothetical protein [Hyphomonas sp.]HRJ01375.1 hypothetical protein [Hyphomonas sp.]HRK68258.1 hypothetical protein [Hyphomonas sp.]